MTDEVENPDIYEISTDRAREITCQVGVAVQKVLLEMGIEKGGVLVLMDIGDSTLSTSNLPILLQRDLAQRALDRIMTEDSRLPATYLS